MPEPGHVQRQVAELPRGGVGDDRSEVRVTAAALVRLQAAHRLGVPERRRASVAGELRAQQVGLGHGHPGAAEPVHGDHRPVSGRRRVRPASGRGRGRRAAVPGQAGMPWSDGGEHAGPGRFGLLAEAQAGAAAAQGASEARRTLAPVPSSPRRVSDSSSPEASRGLLPWSSSVTSCLRAGERIAEPLRGAVGARTSASSGRPSTTGRERTGIWPDAERSVSRMCAHRRTPTCRRGATAALPGSPRTWLVPTTGSCHVRGRSPVRDAPSGRRTRGTRRPVVLPATAARPVPAGLPGRRGRPVPADRAPPRPVPRDAAAHPSPTHPQTRGSSPMASSWVS